MSYTVLTSKKKEWVGGQDLEVYHHKS